MTGRRVSTVELAFAAEGMAGTAGASALRRVRSLADHAPSGRMFAAIATLSDLSRRIETGLEAGDRAAHRGDETAAAQSLVRAIVDLDRLAVVAEDGAATALPEYLSKRG